MTGKRIYLIAQSVACAALAAMLILAAIGICREGLARRAENPTESVYTPEIVAEKLAPIAPLFFLFAGMSVAGLALGVRGDDKEGQAVRSGPRRGAAFPPGTAAKQRWLLQAVLLVVAVALIIIGALNGGARDALYKAINICTECIGLG